MGRGPLQVHRSDVMRPLTSAEADAVNNRLDALAEVVHDLAAQLEEFISGEIRRRAEIAKLRDRVVTDRMERAL